jgi:hypothetical protein
MVGRLRHCLGLLLIHLGAAVMGMNTIEKMDFYCAIPRRRHW